MDIIDMLFRKNNEQNELKKQFVLDVMAEKVKKREISVLVWRKCIYNSMTTKSAY